MFEAFVPVLEEPPVEVEEPPSTMPGMPPPKFPPEEVEVPVLDESPWVPEMLTPTFEPWLDPTFHEPDWFEPAFRLWPRLEDQFEPTPSV